jgi:hypothetical protein
MATDKEKPKLIINNRDGTVTEVIPIKRWSPCIGNNCTHKSHVKKKTPLK